MSVDIVFLNKTIEVEVEPSTKMAAIKTTAIAEAKIKGITKAQKGGLRLTFQDKTLNPLSTVKSLKLTPKSAPQFLSCTRQTLDRERALLHCQLLEQGLS